MTDIDKDLLPLPEPVKHGPFGGIYTAEQMREYARAAVLAEREACAKEAEEHDATDTSGYDTAHSIAASIRARSQP